MKRMVMLGSIVAMAILVFVGTAESQQNRWGGGGGCGGGGGGTGGGSLDVAARDALLTALAGPDGEYAARATYAAILGKFGSDVQPYACIHQSEIKHVSALMNQCTKYGVPIPPDTYLGHIPAPATLLEAAQIGVDAEILNVQMYDNLLPVVKSYSSIVNVFTNLRYASLEHHLPAFEAALANGGTSGGGMMRASAVSREATWGAIKSLYGA